MLYKYCAWSKVYSLSNLKNASIRFNMPNRFNDPFDIYPYFKMNEEEREKAMEIFSKDTGIDLKIASQISIDEILNMQRITDRSDATNSRYGITCFSRINDSI